MIRKVVQFVLLAFSTLALVIFPSSAQAATPHEVFSSLACDASDTASCSGSLTCAQTTPTPAVWVKQVASIDTGDDWFTATITTAKVTPTAVPIATIPAGASLDAEKVFSLVNAHRSAIGLPLLMKEEKVCAVAESRRGELNNEVYVTGALHAGFYGKNLPYWATENMVSMPTEEAALSWWLNSPIHRHAIEGNYQYACGICEGKTCDMIFTNYEPNKLATIDR